MSHLIYTKINNYNRQVLMVGMSDIMEMSPESQPYGTTLYRTLDSRLGLYESVEAAVEAITCRALLDYREARIQERNPK